MNLEDETRDILARRREQEIQDMVQGQAELDLGPLEEEMAADAIMENEVAEEANSIPDVQDAISENRVAYENLTEERLREVIEEIGLPPDTAQIGPTIEEVPVQRHRMRLDVANIPVGMTPEQYVSYAVQNSAYFIHTAPVQIERQTEAFSGVQYIDVTQTTAGNIGITTNTTDGTTWVDAGTSSVTPQTRLNLEQTAADINKAEAEAEIQEILPTPEEIAQIKANRLIYHKRQLQYKRELRVCDISITKDDLIITFNNGSHTFYHIDIEGTYPTEKTSTAYRTSRRRRGSQSDIAMVFDFVFDKNMNRLIIDKDSEDKSVRTRRDGRRISCSQSPSCNTGPKDEKSFIVIDKNAFINSRGRVWKLRRKENVLYHQVKAVKNMYKDQFDRIEQLLEWMRPCIEQVHPAEDYDIMYSFGGYEQHKTSEFNLLLKFNDVTISNSIELEHHIGNMIVSINGTHYFHNDTALENRAALRSRISGTRLTFTPEDASKNYQHSHLTTSMYNFGNFCTGDQRYGTAEGYMDEYNLQEHIFRMQSFIRWESLEGGPHNKIENINAHGAVMEITKNIVGMDRKVGNNYFDRLIQEINQTPEKFNVFTPCFSIVNQSGVLRFVADYQMFFQKFMEIIDSDMIRRIHEQAGERLYTYNKEMGTFHMVTDLESVVPEMLINKAQKNMKALTPIYMNGRYHVPRLITRETGDMLKALRFSPEPNAMKEIAQYIMYKLTSKLEEYGNTSERSEES